ncbi:MAG: methyl-accepting chemotaxis protein, partial [Rhizobiales bacterium]|nr:methyl-accepting chemotaxis protein [Hyphomicrobiales bacterium]
MPALRFRSKVTLGFGCLLIVSAISMGVAYFGFGRIAASVAASQAGVAEADLARNIDRELISFRELVRYYVLTGNDADAEAAQAAEGRLKTAIDHAKAGTTDPERLARIGELAKQFETFAATFTGTLKAKQEYATIAENRVIAKGTALRYKLDDIASTAGDAGQGALQTRVKDVATQLIATSALLGTYARKPESAAAASATARLKFLKAAFASIPAKGHEVIERKLADATTDLSDYTTAFADLVAKAELIERLGGEMMNAATSITKLSDSMKQDLLTDQKRIESHTQSIMQNTRWLIVMLA